MPAIRKKTSSRGTTNKRARIKGKVAESRKKAKKAAKKNPQWKSKKPKDPGIPSTFPYKDQILAEVAEERRLIAEAKQAQKEQKRKARLEASGEAEGESIENEEQPTKKVKLDAEPQVVFDGFGSVAGKALPRMNHVKSLPTVDESIDFDEPDSVGSELPTMAAVINKADVVIHMLDVRDPLAFRNPVLEDRCDKEGKKQLFLLNKIDTVPREIALSWANYLRSTVPTSSPVILFKSASAFLPSASETPTSALRKQKPITKDAMGMENVRIVLEKWASETKKPCTHVAVVGITNTGKSSFINSMVQRSAIPIYVLSSAPSRSPSTTTSPFSLLLPSASHQLTSVNQTEEIQIIFIDTPGLTLAPNIDEQISEDDRTKQRARDITLRSKGRIDRLKDPLFAVNYIVQRANTEDLMLFYNLPAFERGDTTMFLSGVSRANGLIKKGGTHDQANAARLVLRDWSTSKFPRVTVPPALPTSLSAPEKRDNNFLRSLYESDGSILENLTTRKEMRKNRGLIKMVSSQTETREVMLDEIWQLSGVDRVSSHEEDDEELQNEFDEADEGNSDLSRVEDVEDAVMTQEDVNELNDEEEDDIEPPILIQKRGNRGQARSHSKPKGVAFTLPPQRSIGEIKKKRQSSSAGGVKLAKNIGKTVGGKEARDTAKSLRKTKMSANKVSGGLGATVQPGEEAYDFGEHF